MFTRYEDFKISKISICIPNEKSQFLSVDFQHTYSVPMKKRNENKIWEILNNQFKKENCLEYLLFNFLFYVIRFRFELD